VTSGGNSFKGFYTENRLTEFRAVCVGWGVKLCSLTQAVLDSKVGSRPK